MVYINEDNQNGNIISFYNDVFIKKTELKDFIVSSFTDSNSRNINAQRNSKKNIVLMSPIKAIIPKELMFKGQGNNYKNKGNITPQTHLLYAYNESPILKYEVNSFKGKGKIPLNFEEQSKVMVERENKKYGGSNEPSTS